MACICIWLVAVYAGPLYCWPVRRRGREKACCCCAFFVTFFPRYMFAEAPRPRLALCPSFMPSFSLARAHVLLLLISLLASPCAAFTAPDSISVSKRGETLRSSLWAVVPLFLPADRQQTDHGPLPVHGDLRMVFFLPTPSSHAHPRPLVISPSSVAVHVRRHLRVVVLRPKVTGCVVPGDDVAGDDVGAPRRA